MTARERLGRWFTEACAGCGVAVGGEHEDLCDWATCLTTGDQRLMCGDRCGGCGQDVWTGADHGTAEAIEFGWYGRFTDRDAEGRESGSWVRCGPDDPDASPDTGRALQEADWDPQALRWRLIRKNCPHCSVPVGAGHDARCSWAVCLATGARRWLACRGRCGTGCGQDAWTGVDPTESAAADFGWWCEPVDPSSRDHGPASPQGDGRADPQAEAGQPRWAPCLPGTPGARADVARVEAHAVWDAAARRWCLSEPQDTAWTPPLPPTADQEGDDDQEEEPAMDAGTDTTTETRPRPRRRGRATAGAGEEMAGHGELVEAPRIAAAVDDDGGEHEVEAAGWTHTLAWLAGLAFGDLAVLTVPALWNAPRSSLADLQRYAKDGDWCEPDSRWLRLAGLAYFWLFAVWVCGALDLVDRLVQRPGRLGVAGLLGLIVWLVLR
ncbi:hypothetical protein [Pseudofrankia inefficax]|uniref:hypothetical protein n=1 Tax=Pseudofrankia inefficax (strain DSM 45817 / CECT 9037 / DDB 130130 / EuI1c) TaxID=298654 RepID=UPI000325B699|nr:hypothetical protein [Pseudofrankia inefficax]